MLSSKISSTQGTPFDPLLTRQAEQNRDKRMDTQAWARASLGSKEQATVTAAGGLPTKHLSCYRKQTTYLRAVWFSPISTSQDLEMDWNSWLSQRKQKKFFLSLLLSHTHTHSLPTSNARHPLLPRVINYANDLCWDCHSYCSHSNTTARKHTGGVHYRACSLKLSPVVVHICPLLVALSESPDEARRADGSIALHFSGPAFASTFVSWGVSQETLKFGHLLTKHKLLMS